MSIPFFLTRQTANLMEDFVRELNQSSALFLLYGDNGVGKTRLLQELGKSRLSERAIYWIDLDSGDGSDEILMDRSAEVEALFAEAGEGDIIIADHFESAIKKSRHQFLQSWSTEGIDKQLYLIIASSSESYDEMAQLAQQYKVQVQSFQLMPFNADEVQAFLGFYLFPDNPSGKLTIPPPLTRQLAAAQGLVGRVIDIVDREASQIQSAAAAPTASSRRGGGRVFAVLSLFVLALGVGWYLFDQTNTDSTRDFATAEPAPGVVQLTTSEPVAEPDPVAEVVALNPPEAASGPETTATTSIDSEPESMPEEPAGSVDDLDSQRRLALDAALANAALELRGKISEDIDEAATDAASEPAALVRLIPGDEPGTVSDRDAVIDDSIVESWLPTSTVNKVNLAAAEPMPLSRRERFEIEMKQSLDWLGQHDDRIGTIQILLLSYANFDIDNYYEFVDGLVQRGVAADKIHVFKTYNGNRAFYSVVYGHYPSRKAAIREFGDLPEALRETSPLGRSVGGLWKEIRRLEARN